MRFENIYCKGIFGVIFCLIAFCAIGLSQSGRKNVTPTPTPEVETSNAEAAKNNAPCEKGLEEVLYLSPKKHDDFVKELKSSFR